MKVTDFKEMTEKHVESCKKIIKINKSCKDITCNSCPFSHMNTVNGLSCVQFSSNYYDPRSRDEKLFESAKEFIELYNNKDVKIDETATVENFKKDSGIKYGLMLSSSEIDFIEDLLNVFVGENHGEEDLENAESVLKNIEKLKNLTTFKRGGR